MERYFLYLETLRKFNNETDENKKKQLTNDLTALKNGLTPVRFVPK